MPEQDNESTGKLWLTIFVLLSLLVHIVTILAIIVISAHMPVPRVDPVSQASPEVALTLLPPPPQPPKPSVFLPTTADTAKNFNPKTPIESEHNTQLSSPTQTARAPDSVMPDLDGKQNHTPDMRDTHYVPATQDPQVASVQPASKPSKPQPKPTPKPAPSTAKIPEPAPTKTPSQQVVKNTVDPLSGLPLLPPIVAATLEPQTPETQIRQVQDKTAARPPPSFEANKSDVAGSQGVLGNASPAANATEFGRYKAKVYRAVGSRWYAKVGQSFQVLPVGTVHIQFTINADGTVDTKVLEGDNSTLQMLLSISLNSITEAAPFDPFTDSLRKEIAKSQGNDGSSYTDDFTFSIYGG